MILIPLSSLILFIYVIIIFIYREKIDLKLINCIFYYCMCTNNGGVIYFEDGNNIGL